MISKISLPHIQGQKIIDKSEDLLKGIYELPWHEKDSSQRKNVLKLMVQNQKTLKLNVKGFYDLDLKNLGAVN